MWSDHLTSFVSFCVHVILEKPSTVLVKGLCTGPCGLKVVKTGSRFSMPIYVCFIPCSCTVGVAFRRGRPTCECMCMIKWYNVIQQYNVFCASGTKQVVAEYEKLKTNLIATVINHTSKHLWYVWSTDVCMHSIYYTYTIQQYIKKYDLQYVYIYIYIYSWYIYIIYIYIYIGSESESNGSTSFKVFSCFHPGLPGMYLGFYLLMQSTEPRAGTFEKGGWNWFQWCRRNKNWNMKIRRIRCRILEMHVG